MTKLKLIAALGLGIMVSACGAVPDLPTRNAPLETVSTLSSAASLDHAPRMALLDTSVQPVTASMRVTDVRVSVPQTLKVSEANRYYPQGDIVWREDPIGNRYEQVQKIFDTALNHGVKDMTGTTPAIMDIEVKRFHALTEKARYTVGGVHSITFLMTLRHAETGMVLAPTREIKANLDAFGGQRAIDAEARGQTQKVRITGHLAEVIRQEMNKPAA
tara:strand:- start:83922 stop:84572 length:651 start_codon:yes stop_codon:yes gene_type:complete